MSPYCRDCLLADPPRRVTALTIDHGDAICIDHLLKRHELIEVAVDPRLFSGPW